ncbi:MAG: asparagine synthetase B [Sphingomonadales bacterium]|nr:asparagine synthetase B [Sphingomonadales bacterium]
MSAIFGILRFDGAPVDPADADRMARSLAHRGPDGREHLCFDSLALGHALLRVNREDRFEAQPLREPVLGLSLVADMRLDNREELARDLDIDAAALAGLADSDVLLRAWCAWGETCVQRLVGDFTFALWDARARRLHLVRDGMGQRGLYLHRGEHFLAFATEIKALWAVAGVPRRLSEVGIGRRLLFPVDPDPDTTLFEGIALLPGGTMRSFAADGAMQDRRYWQPRAGEQHLGKDDAYYVEAYRRIVGEAIACRVRRLETPPVVLFSGGFDSGIIAAVAGPIAAGHGREVLALASVLPEGETRMVRDARAAVAAFAGTPGLDIHYYTRGQDSQFSGLESAFARDDTAMGTDYVRAAAFRLGKTRGARLAMDGHGGDYTVNVRAPAMLGRWLRRGELRHFLREFSARRAVTGQSAIWTLRAEVLPAFLPARLMHALHGLRRGLAPQWQARMVRNEFAQSLIARGLIDPARLRSGKVLYGRWETRWLHLLDKAARGPTHHGPAAAAAGLDFTRPFHDPRVVELGLAIPERLHLREGRERWLARQAFGTQLPQYLLARGPGNDQEMPDMFRAVMDAARQDLALAREADHEGSISRYVDFAKIEAALARPDESRMGDQAEVYVAANAIVAARFIGWFERSNRRGQEPYL